MRVLRSVTGYSRETPKQFCPTDLCTTLPPTIGVNIEVPLNRKLRIAICNGSYGHLRKSKEWLGFPQLAEALDSFYDCTILKVGYNKELEDVLIGSDLVNRLTLTQTASVLKECDLLITTDTCLMHVGDALRVPMVVIWGGSILVKNRPVNGPARIVQHKVECFPCHSSGKFETCAGVRCLSEISVGDVMREVQEMLK
jgi:ADP-heptose:LPS heptosyltransferase